MNGDRVQNLALAQNPRPRIEQVERASRGPTGHVSGENAANPQRCLAPLRTGSRDAPSRRPLPREHGRRSAGRTCSSCARRASTRSSSSSSAAAPPGGRLVLDVPDNFVRRQLVQCRALAELLPHHRRLPLLLRADARPQVGSSSRSCTCTEEVGLPLPRLGHPRQDAEGARLREARVGAEIVGSYDAIRWVPEAHVVPNGLDLSKYQPAPPPRHAPVPRRPCPDEPAEEGTEWIVDACARLPVELDVVENSATTRPSSATSRRTSSSTS